MADPKKYIDLKVGDLDPTGAGKIDTIVIQGDGFIVYLEEDYGISWSTENPYTDFAEDFGDVSNRVLILEGITNNLYQGKELRNINYVLAQGLARVLDDKNSVTANKVLDEFEKSLEEKGRQLLKIEFIVASFVATVIVIIILCLLWMARYGLAFMLGDNAFQLVIASFCGGIGAFVSSFIRSLNFTGDIRVAKSTYRFDGAMRIFFGIIAGFITALAIQSNMLLGIINDLQGSSTSLICFLSTVAGASESLVPSIVKKVEEKV